MQHLSVGRDDSARQTGPGHDLGAPNAASTPVGARIARPHACTRPERRLHGNGERKPCIDRSPASRGQAQNKTAATLSQIKFFHSMWTNLFAVAGTRVHPPAGVIRKRGRSAPSCAQCGRAGHIPAREAPAFSSVFSGEIPPGAQCAPLRPVRGLPLRQTGEIPPQRRKPHFENLCPQAGGSFDRRPALL